MSKIELPSIANPSNVSLMNSNFKKIEDALNEEVLYRKNYVGEPNEMEANLDMNGKEILNVSVGSSPESLATKGYVDQEISEERAYVDQQLTEIDLALSGKFDKTGGPISGPVQMSGNSISGLPNATQLSEPATYDQLLQVESAEDSLVRAALKSFSGTLEEVASWANIPKHSDEDLGDELDAQAKALAARSELLLIDSHEALSSSYAIKGYNLRPLPESFKNGGTLTIANDVLLDEPSGKAFSGAGPFPQTVAAGTNPIGGGFTDRSGMLYVFIEPTAHAHLVGILPTNTPAQNTAALNALRTIGGMALYLPTAEYMFDVFADTGLTRVFGDGKTKTIISLTGASSPVMVQPGPIVHSGIWFKSVAGSLNNCRIGMADYAVFDKCKVSDFIHTDPLPNAWGCYFKNVKGCRLYHVEFDNNSQSDIAILEGTTDLIVEGCFSTSGNLVINLEPNSGTPAMSGIVLSNMAINKLYLQCNDLTTTPDNLVRVEGCVINDLYYDGLGVAFSESKVGNFLNAIDNLQRTYGSSITGLRVSARELIPDPMLSNVGHTGSGCPWTLRFSTAAPIDRYNRAPTGEIVISVNGVASSTSLSTGNLACEQNTPYLFTICKEVLAGGTRPNIVSVGFKDSVGALIGTETYLARNLAIAGPDRHQHILVSPAGATFVELTVYGGDTASTYQSIAYRYVSIRKVEARKTGVDSGAIGSSSFPQRVKLPQTKALYDAGNLYWAPLPVGTEVEFAYAAAAARLAKVTAQAADNTGKIGTLQIVANYP